MTKPNILHIITEGDLGGAQTHLLDLATHLTDDYQISVAMGIQGALWQRLELFNQQNSLQNKNITLHHLPDLVQPIKPLHDLKALIQIAALIKQLQPRLVCLHSSKAGLLGRLAARYNKTPAVFTAHGWAFTEGVSQHKRIIYSIIERIMAGFCCRIICVSDYDRQLALKYKIAAPDKLIKINNCLPKVKANRGDSSPGPTDTPRHGNGSSVSKANPIPNTSGMQQANRNNHHDSADPVRLIMVARQAVPKDHRLLLWALSQINTNTPFALDVVGDGPLLASNRRLARQLGLAARVNFLGASDNVTALLARAHIFVLISRWEGYPISILEAMRAGLPVVASDVGGVGEMVQHGHTGYLVQGSDSAGLQQKLTRLIDDPTLRNAMGQNGCHWFHSHATMPVQLAQTKKVYASCLKT